MEDNQEHFSLFEAILTTFPGEVQFDIDHFVDADIALRKLLGRSPDVLLLDLNLPDSSGIQTFEKFSKFPTVIVMSVLEDLEIGSECVKQGAFVYLVKDWIFNNPLLLPFMLSMGHELSLNRQRLKVLIKERLKEFRSLVPRCKFCIKRIGQIRLKDEATNEWYTYEKYMELNEIMFTDGICPECFQDIQILYG